MPPPALLVTSVGQKDMMSQKTEPVCEAESCRRALGPLGGLSPAGDTVQLCVGSSSTAVLLVNPRTQAPYSLEAEAGKGESPPIS